MKIIRKPNRILSFLLTAAMLLIMLPAMSIPARAAVNQRTDALVIAYNTPSEDKLSTEGWAWYLTAADGYEANTLVLNGVNIETTAQYALDVPGGATIVLMAGSTNVVKSTYNGDLATAGVHGSMSGTLTISGTGTLNAEGGSTNGNYQFSAGIYMGPNSAINSGTINATGGTVSVGNSYGITTGGALTISGGKVTATGAEQTAGSTGSTGINVGGALTIFNAADVTTTGKTSSGTSGTSYGVQVSGNTTLSGSSKLTASAGNTASYTQAVYVSGTLELSDTAKLTGTSGNSTGSLSCGVRATGTITLSDSAEVTGTAGNISSASFSRGVMGGSIITMNGGTLSGTGGNNTGTGTSAGVYGTTVSMTGGSIIARSGTTTGTSTALWLTSSALTGASVADASDNILTFDNTNKGYYVYKSDGEYVSGTDTLTKYAKTLPAYTISGKITGSDTNGAGISGASVQLKSGGSNMGSAVNTDINGEYTILDVANGTYTIDVSKTGYDSGTIASFSISNANVTDKDLTLIKAADPTYPVTLTVNKDGSAYNSHGKTFHLYQSGASKYTGSGADGTVTFSAVDNGIYDVYDGTADTGIDVTVNSMAASAALNYYTVQFEVEDVSPAAGSTISATYDSAVIASGDVVSGGRTLTITAVGAGAASYTYAWTGDGTSSETSASLIKTTLAEKVNATCTVTGSNDPAYTLTVNAGTGGTASGGGSYTAGYSVSITAIPDSDYIFSGWTSSNGGTFADASSESTTFTMPGNATIITASFTQNIGGAPVITTSSLPNGTVGKSYNQTLAATGDATITWSRDSGYLPAGLTLNSDGTITGTPEALGTSTFVVKAENSLGSDTKSLSITITNTPAKQEEKVYHHEHYYQWTVITDASLNADGKEQYICSCGDVKETLIIPASQVYIKGLYGEIKDASEGAFIEYNSYRWTGINDYVIRKLADRPDLSVKITFEYKNESYTFTLPAGTSYEALLQDQETYYGFFTFCNLLGIPVSQL